MADVPRRRTHDLGARPETSREFRVGLLAAVAAAILSAVPPAAAESDDAARLIGTWHVLIHYTDDHSHDPEQVRWDDRIWVFERSGSRLRWTRYPIVVFRDKDGRFEQRGGMRAARTLRAWEPNENQRAQIAAGLEVNSRGQKSKTLRPGKDGFRSSHRMTAASASVVSYVENWSITGLPNRPVFRREDYLGSARTESLEGVEQFAATAVDPSGDEISGSYERDGVRRGRFRMTRSGESRGVKGRARSTGQRFHEQFLGNLEALLTARESAIRGAADRPSAQAEIRRAVEQSVTESNGDTELLRPEIESLTRAIERHMLDDGQSPADIDEMLEAGRINP